MSPFLASYITGVELMVDCGYTAMLSQIAMSRLQPPPRTHSSRPS
jgi:hypothetical protein